VYEFTCNWFMSGFTNIAMVFTSKHFSNSHFGEASCPWEIKAQWKHLSFLNKKTFKLVHLCFLDIFRQFMVLVNKWCSSRPFQRFCIGWRLH